jgi:hypothetical protein
MLLHSGFDPLLANWTPTSPMAFAFLVAIWFPPPPSFFIPLIWPFLTSPIVIFSSSSSSPKFIRPIRSSSSWPNGDEADEEDIFEWLPPPPSLPPLLLEVPMAIWAIAEE